MANSTDTARTFPGQTGTAGNLRNTASDVPGMLEDGRDAAADALHRAKDYMADSVGQLPGVDAVQRTAAKAADAVGVSADYLRQADLQQMAGDVENLVKRHPGPSLLVAGVLGFVLGRALSR